MLANEIEQYNLACENNSHTKTLKNPLICSSSKQINKHISYEWFASNMKKLNDE
jgi:hypothetical protein